jgi:hypothetical protein
MALRGMSSLVAAERTKAGIIPASHRRGVEINRPKQAAAKILGSVFITMEE